MKKDSARRQTAPLSQAGDSSLNTQPGETSASTSANAAVDEPAVAVRSLQIHLVDGFDDFAAITTDRAARPAVFDTLGRRTLAKQ